MKGKGLTIAIIVIFVAGLSLLLYPFVSNYWNSIHQAQAIVDYDKDVVQMDQETNRRLRAEAEEWNRTTAHTVHALDASLVQTYYDLLDPNDRDIMGYLEIPSLGITLPVAHGTEEGTLQTAVGHLEWSSLPTGGKGNHCVLSGHRGLPSSELLTNIDRMEKGDLFSLRVLDQTLEYLVDQIAVVEPDDFSLLGKVDGKDYVTLLTCTPYGINSHRLLVRGVRVDRSADGADAGLNVRSDVEKMDLRLLIPVVLVLLAVVIFMLLLWDNAKRARGGKRLARRFSFKMKGGADDETTRN